MAAFEQEKVEITSSNSPGSSWDMLTQNPIVTRIADTLSVIQSKREALGLPYPGHLEQLSKEVDRDVFLNNYSFAGLRADISKAYSVGNPMFQVSHSFAMGSQSLAPYSFGAMYGSPNTFMQATIDNDKSLAGRFNWRWTPSLVTKVAAQIAPSGSLNPSAVTLENEYTGSDFSASIKGNNLSLLEGGLTGTVSGEYFQSITPRLALGLNAIWERPSFARGPDMIMTYGARYKGLDWIGSARLMPMLGLVQLSYWRKLADKVEAGVNMELSLAPPGGPAGMMGQAAGPEGQATIGAKYDFRGAVFRGQVDSNGRVSAMLEKRLNPMVACTFIGSIDHVKNDAKLGLSVSIESMTEDVMEQQQRMHESGEEVQSPPF